LNDELKDKKMSGHALRIYEISAAALINSYRWQRPLAWQANLHIR